MDEKRYKRVRLLVRELNKARRVQSKKIDILCNDMVSVHGDFVGQLMSLEFMSSFYRGLLGCTDLTAVLDAGVKMIGDGVSRSNVAIFLLESEGFELHLSDGEVPIEVHDRSFAGYFTAEVVRNICAKGQICRLEDMFEAGLTDKATQLGEISAVAMPLKRVGPSMGFILIYGELDKKPKKEELQRIASITPGLCAAIESCQRRQRVSSVQG